VSTHRDGDGTDEDGSSASLREQASRREQAWPSGRLVEDRAPLVAVGASAGGLEALKRLLGALPIDADLALVVIQHLSPTHESLLTSSLRSSSPLPVIDVQDDMPVEPGTVHVIPPNATLVLESGRLRLHRRSVSERPPMPIDAFMRSLAAERQRDAIGVVLSGTGSDGTHGLEAIRAAGGRTYAQDPSTALHDGMPRSAITADVADVILSPEAIAGELAAFARAMAAPSDGEGAPAVDGDATFRQILELMKERKGVDVSHYKATTLRRRVARRIALVRAAGDEEYLRRLREDPEELDALYGDLFIHVTSFFRDPEVFAALGEQVFPELLRGRTKDAPMRMWVPGCSTGEEVYSLAIAGLELVNDHKSDIQIQVFGTDISEQAIQRARTAVYPPGIAEHVGDARLRRYFEPTPKGYRIARFVRDTCVFVRHDLTVDPPFSRIDLLSCRNVLIYFDPVLQKQIVPLFHYALAEPGFLVMGRSEALSGFGELFALRDKQHRIYARQPGAGRTRPLRSATVGPVELGSRPRSGAPSTCCFCPATRCRRCS
jgi:two-component system, chemotaxis family, CheB/CheR fusion protein